MLPTDLPSGTVRYELNDGKLVIISPPGFRHGRTGLKIAAQLLIQGEARGLGEAVDECEIILRRDPDRVAGAAFVAAKSLPARLSPEGYLETIAELVVEVRSKNDSDAEVEAKVQDYLASGVTLVWVADPEARTVVVHSSSGRPTVFTAADTLGAEPVLPGFVMALHDLFPD